MRKGKYTVIVDAVYGTAKMTQKNVILKVQMDTVKNIVFHGTVRIFIYRKH